MIRELNKWMRWRDDPEWRENSSDDILNGFQKVFNDNLEHNLQAIESEGIKRPKTKKVKTKKTKSTEPTKRYISHSSTFLSTQSSSSRQSTNLPIAPARNPNPPLPPPSHASPTKASKPSAIVYHVWARPSLMSAINSVLLPRLQSLCSSRN